MEELIHFDKQLLLWFNGSDSLFMDSLIMTLTTAQTWIPLYLALLYVVIRSNRSARDILLVVAGAGVCVLLAGTIDDTIVKPLVARWRPGRDPEIGMLVDTVNGYRGGKYGFFSAHAANTFGFALCAIWGFKNDPKTSYRRFNTGVLVWAGLVSLSRIFVAKHYLGDVLVGAAVGCGYGILFGLLAKYLIDRFFTARG